MFFFTDTITSPLIRLQVYKEFIWKFVFLPLVKRVSIDSYVSIEVGGVQNLSLRFETLKEISEREFTLLSTKSFFLVIDYFSNMFLYTCCMLKSKTIRYGHTQISLLIADYLIKEFVKRSKVGLLKNRVTIIK